LALFGFVQLDFAGTLPLADGRYLAAVEEGESVLVVKTLGAPPPSRRRRRRARDVGTDDEPASLPLTRITAIRAFVPIEAEPEAQGWLEETLAEEAPTDAVVADAVALLNRALHAQAVAAAEPLPVQLAAEWAAAVRIGYGSGEQVAHGEFAVAREIDARSSGTSRRQQREQDLRPQERMAAVLRGRESLNACEPLLLRARADLDADRSREAALQLRIGFEALLAELDGALDDPDHDEDMATLRERRGEVGEAANEALRGELSATTVAMVGELLGLCERVLRRRRVLRG
jgi:hypothetical protein